MQVEELIEKNKFSAASLSRAARRLRGRGIYPALDQRERRSLWNPIPATPQQADGEFFSIKSLSPERIAEVEDFVDFIARRDDRQLVQAAAKLDFIHLGCIAERLCQAFH